ncbi:uncharacterized protein LOC114265644 [Camellia sinensis]|uniref:uncharacterized protein LOC114265644 n=1 Tax=Camellia sinensis TaxID=4442 RepID=UPI00103620C5|nr:uncharacterized protein LOC114265644 [Camellia sinensis]
MAVVKPEFRMLKQHKNVKVVALSNPPQNLKLTSLDIQKDIVNVATIKTINVIIRDLGDAFFSILIDEARDISIKEQMAVVIRYVDKKGQAIERFMGIGHVANTNALSLKQAVENLFSRLGLSISRLRGQGYNGASNMQAVAKNHDQIALVFTLVSNVVNVVGASCKCRDIVREKQAAKVAEPLNTGELSSGQGLNQETNLKCAVIDVLEMISKNGSNSEQRAEANVLLDSIQSFEFVFNLHLMKTILAITKFSSVELIVLSDKLDTYIIDMLSSIELSRLNGIADLAKKMVETERDKIYPLVYLLLTLALILPVATATVERVYSTMNIVKNRLRNRMGDEWINDSLVVYIEREIFDGIDNDTIMERFQKMKTRRGQL